MGCFFVTRARNPTNITKNENSYQIVLINIFKKCSYSYLKNEFDADIISIESEYGYQVVEVMNL